MQHLKGGTAAADYAFYATVMLHEQGLTLSLSTPLLGLARNQLLPYKSLSFPQNYLLDHSIPQPHFS